MLHAGAGGSGSLSEICCVTACTLRIIGTCSTLVQAWLAQFVSAVVIVLGNANAAASADVSEHVDVTCRARRCTRASCAWIVA